MRRLGTTVSVLIGLVTGCATSGATDGGDSDTPIMTVGCTDDSRAMTYAAHLQRAGTGGVFGFELVSSDPAPPARGDNTWVLALTDSGGAAVAGADLVVTPRMPDHGHGTSVVPTITDGGDGTYTIDPLDLFMPGLWEVTIDATGGEATDTTTFAFCIEG